MSSQADSIKCKYCSHFNPETNHCHLYFDYDQSLDSHGDQYLKTTSPDSRCSHFKITARDSVLKSLKQNVRNDGSLILSLHQVPELQKYLTNSETSFVDKAKDKFEKLNIHNIFIWLFIGFIPSFLVSFGVGIIFRMHSFPIGIMLMCLFLFGYIGSRIE